MPPIRVLVADDSTTVRKRLIEVLSADAALQVVAEAADGRTATELCQRLRPDVMTMDVMMPVMDGVRATEYIMAQLPYFHSGGFFFESSRRDAADLRRAGGRCD